MDQTIQPSEDTRTTSRVKEYSQHTSDLLSLAYPLFDTCALAWLSELTDKATYVEFETSA